MKRLLLLLFLLPLFTFGQAPTNDSTKLTAPPAIHPLSFGSLYMRGGNASNAQVGFLDITTGKWSQLVTGYQANHYYAPIAASGNYIQNQISAVQTAKAAINQFNVGNSLSSQLSDPNRSLIVTPINGSYTSLAMTYYDMLGANIRYSGAAHNQNLTGVAMSQYFIGEYVPGISPGFDAFRIMSKSNGINSAGTATDQVEIRVSNWDNSSLNGMQMLQRGIYFTKQFLLDTARYNPGTMSSYFNADTSGSITFHNNNSGAVFKPYAFGGHYIVGYNYGLAQNSTNWFIASDSTQQTAINNSHLVGMAINGANVVSSTTSGTTITGYTKASTYFQSNATANNTLQGTGTNFFAPGNLWDLETHTDNSFNLVVNNSNSPLNVFKATQAGGVLLPQLSSNGLVTTSGGTGALSITPTTGSGNVVLATSPTLVTPALGTPTALVGTNITGTASGLNIGGNAATVTTIPTLTGDVSNSGNAITVNKISGSTTTIPSSFVNSSITSIGTIATGTWHGTAIDGTYINYNATNLKVTSSALNTIQDICTTCTPTFGGTTITGNPATLTLNGTSGLSYLLYNNNGANDWVMGTRLLAGNQNLILYNYGTSSTALSIDKSTNNVTFGAGISATTITSNGNTITGKTESAGTNSTAMASTAYADRLATIHGNSTTTGTATTAVTVTIGSTMANTTYNTTITPRDLLTAVNYYISAQSTTTFTVTFVTALTGSINFDWGVTP